MALGDYNIIVHEKHALHITQVCIPCNIGGIILLSRAYFPHLFHIISAKAKKSFSFSQKTFKKWPLLVGRTSAICHLLKYAQGQRLTHAVAISRWDLTLAHAVMLPKYAQKKNSRGPGGDAPQCDPALDCSAKSTHANKFGHALEILVACVYM